MLQPFYAMLRHHVGAEDQQYTLRRVVAALHVILADPWSALEYEPRLTSTPVILPFACGASRYRGTVRHPALGRDGSQDFVLTVQRQDGDASFEGRWEAFGHTGLARVILDASQLEVMMYFETPLGEATFDGVADATSGVLSGTFELSGSEGVFNVKPVDFTDEVSAAEQRNLTRLRTIRSYTKNARHLAFFAAEFVWQEDWFSQEFSCARRRGTNEAWRSIMTEHIPGRVFSFNLFTECFCDSLVEEILNFYASGLPIRRPNSMNNYGVILAEMGLETFADSLQELLQPLGERLWPGPGTAWDEHHCFVVRYRDGEDLGLDMHHDDSDVTFNICLGLRFEGAGLRFCGMVGEPDHRKQRLTYQHVKGRCVVHLGRHRHGADDITSGDRMNLILWNRSSEYRKSSAFRQPSEEREEGPPDLQCLSFTHDRDYGVFMPYPPGKEHLASRAWCPPRDAEYR
eukprot:CAMPEP_0117478178 /NCGR_PEP_ID=MMETSP0784-20121206/11207_1 /TAXON_ID=39447 /ORGANISM="" /LENGTH=458 /DNA_ID=CAMNT_0005272509 /DNA_START=171 /DNA_END=1543 /DNA_ORIENTATION=-